MSLDGSCSGTMTGDDMVPSAKIMRSWFVPNIFFWAGYELIPGGRHDTLVCAEILFFGGRVRAGPRRLDQLMPSGCANTKIV